MRKIVTIAIVAVLVFATYLFATDAMVIGADGVVRVQIHGWVGSPARQQSLDSAVSPIGSIQAYGGTTDPPGNESAGGWLLCDGRALLSTEYPKLFAIIGTSFGDGTREVVGRDPDTGVLVFADVTPSGDFNLPDLRGQFLRGVDDRTNGIDPATFTNSGGSDIRLDAQGNPVTSGAPVGSLQGDAFQGHWHRHQVSFGNRGTSGPSHNTDLANLSATGADVSPDARARAAISDGTNGAPRTSDETRPTNVAVNYIIKY